MSLFSKFTSIFQSNTSTQVSEPPTDPRIVDILYVTMKPSLKFNLKNAYLLLKQYILEGEEEENLDSLFTYLSLPQKQKDKNLGPLCFIQLLGALHKLFLDKEIQYEMAIKIREKKIYWLSHIEQDKENQKLPFVLETEPIQVNSQMDNRKIALFMDDQKNSMDDRNANLQTAVDLQQFVKSYYVYLQRLAANVDLYRYIYKGTYPYMNLNEYIEPKLMFLWHYKIQNILNTGLNLIVQPDLVIMEFQKLIWNDLQMFQQFIGLELGKVIVLLDQYATLPNSDTLSLYEIYNDCYKHYEAMVQFKSKSKLSDLKDPIKPNVKNNLLQDFLNFATKIKLLNQITFKKSIVVPNKDNPCMGIPMHHPHVYKTLHHLRAVSGVFQKNNPKLDQESPINLKKKVKEEIEKEQQQSDDEEEKDEVMEIDNKEQQARKAHLRGFSTFQNQ